MIDFATAVDQLGEENIPDHFTREMDEIYEIMRSLKNREDKWFGSQEKYSDEYNLFYHMAQMYYFLGELSEIPHAHRLIKKCFNVWYEEPSNVVGIEQVIEDVWD